MHRLTNRKILLGISGGIAAYKSAELCRQLIKAGAEVKVVMTQGAQAFITPLTMQAVSGNPVHTSLLDPAAEAGMGHIELAKWADTILVAPASANLIARLATGFADDLLSTLVLATEADVILAPAMNQAMWRNPRTQRNVQTLAEDGVQLLGPDSGIQACGDTGPGRMLEPAAIVEALAATAVNDALAGLKVTITAGPTREALDPVRFLSNHSSGKMGFALASAARDAGAEVTLIAGPVHQPTPDGIKRVDVVTAEEMYAAAMSASADCHLFIAAAAVADYRPHQIAGQKIKKGDETGMTLELTRNPDILASVAASASRPFCVGFAAETEHVIEHARAKLERKHLDLVIANDVADPSIGFNSDDNAVVLIRRQDSETLPKTSKTQLARQLIEKIALQLRADENTPGKDS